MKNTGLENMLRAQVQRTILKMIQDGELLTKEQADQQTLDNLQMFSKITTIAINQACGIGRTRIQRDIQPIIDRLYAQWLEDQSTTDQDYADSKIIRMCEAVMHTDTEAVR